MAVLPPEKLVPVAELDAYLMDPKPFAWSDLLGPFSPPLPREGEVILASFWGDVFVEDPDGAVWWVNGLESQVGRIAINRAKALERIGREHLVMLKTKLLEQMIRADRLLPAGMLYGLKVPRSEGGKYHPDNIGTAPVADAFAFLGDQYRKKNAPPTPPEVSAVAGKPRKAGLWGKKT